MPKWFGIRVSAVLAILGSLFTLAAALSMGFAATRPPQAAMAESPIPIRVVMTVMCILFAAFSVWGIATAIGVLRRRGWARFSMIIFAILLVGMGGSALIGILFIQLPDTGNVSPQAMQYVRIGIAAVYAAMTVIGAWWLLLFNSSATKQYFAARDAEPGGRPLSISIIGWYLLIASLGTAVSAILRVPAVLFGIVFTSWGALAVYTLFTAVQIYLGTGLLNLQNGARVGAIAFFGVLMGNSVAWVLIPGFDARMQTMLQTMPGYMRGGQAVQSMPGIGGIMLIGVVFLAVPIWFLVARRSAFR